MLMLTSREQLGQSYLLKEKWWSDIVNIREITWQDVTEYTLDTSSTYIKEWIKKSLEAYDCFVYGHVKNCYYREILQESKFCFIKSQVHVI